VRAMVLAAGHGTRLGALGRSIPKVLVPIGGRPLLERQLEYLEREGVSRVIINAHHLASQITSFVARYRGPLQVSCIVEESLLGTAGGVRNALGPLGPGSFLVLYGDVIVDVRLAAVMDFHRRHDALATLVVHEAESAEGKGVVRVGSNGRVGQFEEKMHREPGPALVNSGVYVIEPELLASLPAGTAADFGDDVFPSALARGLPIFSYRIAAAAIDIGTPDGLALAGATVREAV
jgi:mannose-1-phosphate guanylyltransferase / phosphomannomutase